MDLEKYLEEEGIIERTTSELLEFLAKEESLEFSESINKVILSHAYGRMSNFEYYQAICKKVGGFPIYDLIKSRLKGACKWILEKTSKDISRSNSRNITDVGCATGLEAVYLAQKFPKIRIIGIDLLEKMLDYANERALKRKVENVCFKSGDFSKLPDNNDTLICLNVLYENNEGYLGPEEVFSRIEKLRASLKEGGKLYLGVPTESDHSEDSLLESLNPVLEEDLYYAGFEIVKNYWHNFTNRDGYFMDYSLLIANAVPVPKF